MSRPRGTNGTVDRYEQRRTINPALSWYVVQARPAAEVRAADELKEHNFDVWLPRFWTITVRRNRRVEVERLCFPGYLFAGSRYSPPRRSEYVADVLGADGPLRMPDGLVQAIADRLTGDVKSERIQAIALFRVGEMRSIVQGPFRDFLARVTELLHNGRVRVEVAGKPVELDPAMLGAA